ncbi:MAG TPA: hypothetical protein VIZ90_05275 [Rhizobiaceae bacterium]
MSNPNKQLAKLTVGWRDEIHQSLQPKRVDVTDAGRTISASVDQSLAQIS